LKRGLLIQKRGGQISYAQNLKHFSLSASQVETNTNGSTIFGFRFKTKAQECYSLVSGGKFG